MSEKAEFYNKQGVRLISSELYEEAIAFFSKAIEIDPQFLDAYHNRGEAFLKINRIREGNSDIQKANELRSQKSKKRIKAKAEEKKSRKIVRLNWQEVESIYDTVFPEGSHQLENTDQEFDNNYRDNVFPYTDIERERTRENLVRPSPQTQNFPVILELVVGRHLQFARARLFEPTKNDISIIREDGHVERVIPLEHMSCIRMDGLPVELNRDRSSLCYVESIETVDGNVHRIAVHPEQDYENVIFGFSTSEQKRFRYIFIPRVNINKRCQDRFLGEILLEKGFIGDAFFKDALTEHQHIKNMKLGEIIARKANVMYAAIEKLLQQAEGADASKKQKTGEILLTAGLVDEQQVAEALQYQKCLQNLKIGQFLIEKGVVQEKEVCLALAEKFRIPFIDLQQQKISKNTLTILSKNLILRNEILPISYDNNILTVATLHPQISDLRKAIIKECSCKEVRFVLALPAHLRIILDLLSKKEGMLGRS